MSQKVGEMFMELGVKGSNATVGALGEARKGIMELGSMSLEAKAAIIGLFYTLEKLFTATGQQGVALTNMNTVTGMSVKTLQQYEFALRQVGGTAAEMDQTFKGLQNSITNMIFGKGAPERLLAVVSQLKKAGIDIGNQEQKQWAEHPEKLLQRLQQYAQLKTVPLFEKSNFLKSFGLGDNVVAALEKNAFRPEIFKQASVYSDKTVAGLNASAIAWSNVADKFEHAFGMITSKFGGPLAADFEKLVDPVAHLAAAIIELSDKMKLLQGIGKTFEGWAKILNLGAGGGLGAPAKGGVVDKINPTGTAPLPWNIPELWQQLKNELRAQERLDERNQKKNAPAGPTTINQTFNGKAEPEKVKDATVDGVTKAHGQSPALKGGV